MMTELKCRMCGIAHPPRTSHPDRRVLSEFCSDHCEFRFRLNMLESSKPFVIMDATSNQNACGPNYKLAYEEMAKQVSSLRDRLDNMKQHLKRYKLELDGAHDEIKSLKHSNEDSIIIFGEKVYGSSFVIGKLRDLVKAAEMMGL